MSLRLGVVIHAVGTERSVLRMMVQVICDCDLFNRDMDTKSFPDRAIKHARFHHIRPRRKIDLPMRPLVPQATARRRPQVRGEDRLLKKISSADERQRLAALEA